MSERATLQSIGRSGHRKNFPLIWRAAARTPCGKPFHTCFRSAAGLWHNPIAAAGAMSVTLTNAKKQARYVNAILTSPRLYNNHSAGAPRPS
jgi:hypothetical protein